MSDLLYHKQIAPEELEALGQWFAERLPGEGPPRISALAQTAGNSHAIYSVIRDPDHRWVLRVAPDHGEAKVGNAYNLSREWSVLKALADTVVPHAAPVLHQDGTAPIDRDFLLVEFVDGIVLEGAVPEQYSSPDDCLALSDAIVDTLADIARTDWRNTGFAEFGHPEGYLERQFDKGRQMLDSFRTRDTPALAAMIDSLERQRPATSTLGIVHGDYSPMNLMAAPHGPPRIAAVLDWETATLGDVMIDIGYLTARWVRPEECAAVAAFALGGSNPADHENLPPRTRLAQRYADRTGLSIENLPYYQGFAMARVAIALEGRVAAFTRRGDDASAALFASLVDTAVDYGARLMNS
ncbi:phosphotransferase family protein [Nocardia sp. CA2R105]|uniref:phosphotransferase family protein n=1 Tax=Nocardia coffeae TaxID=2873381 RepID=UPI001CA64EE1|nr:phosphotransferase family protein [Nocardia coffeae]MBY8854963.1 phosphotransferase family protein [Nocardia coffeae]